MKGWKGELVILVSNSSILEKKNVSTIVLIYGKDIKKKKKTINTPLYKAKQLVKH